MSRNAQRGSVFLVASCCKPSCPCIECFPSVWRCYNPVCTLFAFRQNNISDPRLQAAAPIVLAVASAMERYDCGGDAPQPQLRLRNSRSTGQKDLTILVSKLAKYAATSAGQAAGNGHGPLSAYGAASALHLALYLFNLPCGGAASNVVSRMHATVCAVLSSALAVAQRPKPLLPGSQGQHHPSQVAADSAAASAAAAAGIHAVLQALQTVTAADDRCWCDASHVTPICQPILEHHGRTVAAHALLAALQSWMAAAPPRRLANGGPLLKQLLQHLMDVPPGGAADHAVQLFQQYLRPEVLQLAFEEGAEGKVATLPSCRASEHVMGHCLPMRFFACAFEPSLFLSASAVRVRHPSLTSNAQSISTKLIKRLSLDSLNLIAACCSQVRGRTAAALLPVSEPSFPHCGGLLTRARTLR